MNRITKTYHNNENLKKLFHATQKPISPINGVSRGSIIIEWNVRLHQGLLLLATNAKDSWGKTIDLRGL